MCARDVNGAQTFSQAAGLHQFDHHAVDGIGICGNIARGLEAFVGKEKVLSRAVCCRLAPYEHAEPQLPAPIVFILRMADLAQM